MTDPAKARFEPVDDAAAGFDVMFNPGSLKVTLTNRLQDEQPGSGGNGQPTQNTRESTTKLETELIFDTTETGTDVRDWSGKLKALARAAAGDNPAPPRVLFRWGRFSFSGLIESLGETLDFWSSEGVPLRSTMQLTMQGLEPLAPPAGAPDRAVLNRARPGGRGATDAATRAGDAGAGRGLAAANGLESMRMPGGGALAVGAGVQLKAAAGFSLSASASAGLGLGAGASAGFGAGASAGFGAGASAGFGASAFGAAASAGAGASAGFGASAGVGVAVSAGFGATASAGFGFSGSAGNLTTTSFSGSRFTSTSFGAASFSSGGVIGSSSGFGANASAGVWASNGAFAGLGVSKTVIGGGRLEPYRLLPRLETRVLGSGAQFDATGRFIAGGSAGLGANVTGVRLRAG